VRLQTARVILLFTAFCVIYAAGICGAFAQELPSVSTTPPAPAKGGEAPIVITADGQNTYVGNIATADDNVVVHYKGDVIFADHIIYDRATKVVIANGNVRIFSEERVYRGDSITYNLETKAIESSAFFGLEYPKLLSAKHVTTPGINHYRLTDATFTTSNRENPSFHLKAGTVEYRPNDEVVFKNVLLVIGNVPVFYFPVLVQSLTDDRPVYQFEVGAGGQFGAFIENKYNWVADSQLRGTTEFDVREKRGYAGGVDLQYFPSLNSQILLRTYFAQDNLYSKANPYIANDPAHGNLDNSNVYDGVPSENRYRISYQQHLQFMPDLYSIADINAWSDPWITRDYFQGEYQAENQPANFVALDQYNPSFNVSLMVSPQVNPFFETVERLPELLFESKQQKIFGSQIEYVGQSSVVNFERKFADTNNFLVPNDYIYASNPAAEESGSAYHFYHPNATYDYNTAANNDYSAYRYDTYHELSYPHQYFGFLSLTPRIGGRFTYYSDDNDDVTDTVNNNGQNSDKITNPQARLAANVGLAGDFKVSRTWSDISAPNFGINGIRHVVEPFFDSAYAPEPTLQPNKFRGFDDQLYNTQLQPLDQSQINSIDSLDRQAVVRLGIWNKIQTKRDGANYDLLTWETYGDADFDHNYSASTPNSTLSNLFNDVRFYPIPQLQFRTLTSFDVQGTGGYSEIDNDVTWAPEASLQATVGYHSINHSPIFGDNNSASLDLFYRLNEHYQVEAQEQFQGTDGHLQLQEYTVYRDLDAWQLAMTFSDAEISNGHDEQSIYFSLTLKALPKYQLRTPSL
jgi:LPS-assembly protein